MEISEYIYNHLNLWSNARNVSELDDLRDFFAEFPPSCNNECIWPLSAQKDNESVLYYTAKIEQANLGFSQYLNCVTGFKTPNAELIVAETMEYDDCLQIEFISVIKKSGVSGSSFLYELVRRHMDFIKAFDASREMSNILPPSRLKLNAYSGKVGDVMTSGGYVWAVQGFDFETDYERDLARREFKFYAATHGICIKDKDLKLFTKPCHFAAFQCGKKVQGKHLGKAFLLRHSWKGKMQVPAGGREPEEYRYARAYNENRGRKDNLQIAAMVLNPKYLRMMKRYNDSFSDEINQQKNIFRRFCSNFHVFG